MSRYLWRKLVQIIAIVMQLLSFFFLYVLCLCLLFSHFVHFIFVFSKHRNIVANKFEKFVYNITYAKVCVFLFFFVFPFVIILDTHSCLRNEICSRLALEKKKNRERERDREISLSNQISLKQEYRKEKK